MPTRPATASHDRAFTAVSAPAVLAAFTVLLVALVWTASIVYVRHARQVDIQSVIKENANLARAVEEHTVRTIKQVDQVALLLKRDLESSGAKPDLLRFSREIELNPELALVVAVTDEHGNVVASNSGSARPNVSDREHFQTHLARDSGRLAIGKATVGRVAKRWVIPMSRRINKANGSFGGIVIVGVDPLHFSNFYTRIDLGRDGEISLPGMDGFIRARRSGREADVGQDVRQWPLFTAATERQSGSLVLAGAIDGISRIYSYRRFEDYPLMVAVGVEEAGALANTLQRERASFAVATAITVFVLLFSAWLLLLYRRERRADAEIRRLNEDLVAHASELEATNRDLESFSHSVAHDLRSPLRAMNGFGSILRQEHASGLDDEGHRLLQRIVDAAMHMSDLIDGLLALPRLNRSHLERHTVDLSALARDVARELAQREPERRVQWRIADGVNARGDPALLRAVLSNLLHNAWKFTGRRSGASIEFGMARDSDGTPIYFVRDNGAGFDVTFSRHLFEPFQRLHRDEDFPGAGIGLAAVQRIVRWHGGRIWADSAPDKGATFHFTLSAGDAQNASETPPSGHPPPAGIGSAHTLRGRFR